MFLVGRNAEILTVCPDISEFVILLDPSETPCALVKEMDTGFCLSNTLFLSQSLALNLWAAVRIE